MADLRPQGREKHVTGQGKDIYKKGEGLGTGPVGSQGGYSGRGGKQSGGGKRSGGGNLLTIIVAAIVLLGGGGAGLSGLLGGSQSTAPAQQYTQPAQQYTQPAQTMPASQPMSAALSGMLGGFGNTSTGWTVQSNTGRLNTSVASGARAKRTTIRGNGKDVVTIMVYMCGTDLESRNGMGTADLQEMLGATISDKVNLLVYTGGCKQWRNNVVSSSVNQIYKVESGGLRTLVKDDGAKVMTDPNTLASFIKFGAKNYPADRYNLIFWDHGGGSLSGYGYDEKNARAGSMGLSGIDAALKSGGVNFDFIGFDACLMATLETALTVSDYADYLIASEETEPGVGWYYTNWLTKLSQNTSMPTVEIGRNIVDDFVDVCAQKCRGQDTTLSLIDLAELETTVPETFKGFAQSTSKLLENKDYTTVSRARSTAREFSPSNKLDQVDLVDLAANLGTDEAKALAQSLLGAVKYNRTSTSMTDAYGLSIYFPYQRASKVDTAVMAYDAIGMDDDYTRCIQQFASLGVAGQAVAGGTTNPMSALLGTGSSSQSGSLEAEMINQLLGSLLSGGSFGGVSGLTSGNTGFFGRSLPQEDMVSILTDNQFDESALVWTRGEDSSYQLALSEEQWSQVSDVELNVFFDDGAGYIDLGLDNVYSFTDSGALVGEYDGTWLAIDSQPVPYYHISTTTQDGAYTILGRVPCFVNGERGDLLLAFDSDTPYGYIAGWRRDYKDGETDTVAKNAEELTDGDEIQFVCDYYDYDGNYQDSYLYGETYVYDGQPEISNVYIDASRSSATYRFTDLYCNEHWTPVMP